MSNNVKEVAYLESNNVKEVAYLDLNLKCENDVLVSSVYDKRDNFSFEIVNYPYIDSCIPKKSALGVFSSQLIRYARICSKFTDFKVKSTSLVIKLRNQGYSANGLKFFNERKELVEKYNIPSGNIFVREILN